MFAYHASKYLSAYCNGELSTENYRRVREHLIGCQRCRAEYEEIQLGVQLAQQLPVVSAPDSLWESIENRSLKNPDHIGSQTTPTLKQSWWRPRLLPIAASLLLAVVVVGAWFYSRESRPFWEVARLNGAPKIGRWTIKDRGQLAVGEWLETDGTSRAKIDVGTIGHVEIDPNTRVRLVETKPTEHRLELARGRMSARIWAPPRLFFVDTPSGVAADMGCAYTLEVDEEGGGILHVTSGWVALQLRDRESMVPAGAACATRKGIGPGTPYFEDASKEFRDALASVDFGPAPVSSSLDVVLAQSRPRDTLTLWHLLARVNGSDRQRVYDRLAALAPPPQGVTREGVLQLDDKMLALWKDSLTTTWSGDSKFKKVWIDTWTRGLGKIKGEGKK